jgi:ABC-type sugar transport system substrate-binding protein
MNHSIFRRLLSFTFAAALIGLALATTPAEAAKYRIGFVVGDVGNPFHTRVWKMAQSTAEANDVELIILDTKRDISTEANNVDQLIAQQVDLIMIMPTSAEGSRAAIDRAIAAGIPVITVLDSAQGSGEQYVYVGSDFEPWGELHANKLAELLGDKGNIVYIKGGAGFLVEQNRDRLFKAAMENHPNLKIVFEQHGDWNKPSGVTIMEDALARNPEANSIQAVVAHNDNMALGAIEALKRANRLDEVVVGGHDGNADALQALVAGELNYTTFQDGETIGREGIETAVKILEGQEVPKLVRVPLVVIDNEDQATEYLKNVYGL